MRLWHKWIIALAIGCAAQAGLANATGEPAAQAEPGNVGISEELAAALAEIDADFLDADKRAQRIAILIARATRLDPLGTASALAKLSWRLSPEDLSLVSAAAIMSAGTRSPAVLKTLVDAQGDDTVRADAVRLAATDPVDVLGRETAARMQPAELQPPGVNPIEVTAVSEPMTPELFATPQTLPATPPSFAETLGVGGAPTPQPPPPQPPGLPPRPPALPYRGQ